MALQKPDNTLPLRAALSHIFGDIAKSVSKKEFSECQSFLKSQLPDEKSDVIIQKLYDKIVTDVEGRLNEELEELMNEESLIDGLGKLKQLTTEYDSNQRLWRPPGDPTRHLRTIDAMIIDEEVGELSKLVKNLEDENALLTKEISEKRKKEKIINKKIIKATSSGLQSLAKMEKSREQMQQYIDVLEEQH